MLSCVQLWYIIFFSKVQNPACEVNYLLGYLNLVKMVLRHNVNLSYLPETVNFTLLFKFKVFGSKVKHKQRNQTLNGELLIN